MDQLLVKSYRLSMCEESLHYCDLYFQCMFDLFHRIMSPTINHALIHFNTPIRQGHTRTSCTNCNDYWGLLECALFTNVASTSQLVVLSPLACVSSSYCAPTERLHEFPTRKRWSNKSTRMALDLPFPFRKRVFVSAMSKTHNPRLSLYTRE